MNSSYFADPVIFIIETAFSLYILVLMLRMLLQWTNAEYHNPISQFLVKVTHPLVRPLRRVIPAVGRIDSATVLLMLLLKMISIVLIAALQGSAITVAALVVLSIAELLQLLITVFTIAIIVQALMSWVPASGYNAATSLLYSLTEPVLSRVQRFIPAIGGIDLSPLVAIVGLQVVQMVLIPPIQQIASMLN